MTEISKTIVFFGSGPVASASLAFLVRHFRIEAVVTKPVSLHEMRQIVPDSPSYAIQNKHELSNLVTAKHFQGSTGVIVDFGIIVEQSVIDAFPLGIINSHFSLLPRWRGADPISFSILKGDSETGVSLMRIVAALDEGDLLSQDRIPLPQDITTPTLTERLIELSNGMLLRDLPPYMDGVLKPFPQDVSIPATYSRKLTKEDGVLDWGKPAAELEREIRAFSGWPGSRTTLAGKDVIVTKAQVAEFSGRPGQAVVEGKHLYICCAQDALELLELKPAGKKIMPAQAFLAGYKSLLA